MPVRLKRQQVQGFSLVELMIAISIMTFLLLIGTQLTRTWIDQQHLTMTKSALTNAVMTAKSTALKNNQNLSLNSPAVSLCWESNTHQINVVQSLPNTLTLCDINSNVLIDQIQLPTGISLQDQDSAFKCLAFEATGFISNHTDHLCSTGPNVHLNAKKHHENITISLL